MRVIQTMSILLPLLWLTYADAARILGIFPMRTRSHHSINSLIMKSLAAKGHQVTMVSPFKEPRPISNYTEIHIKDVPHNLVDTFNVQKKVLNNAWKVMRSTEHLHGTICTSILQSDFMKNITKSKSFDLLFVEMYRIPCYLPLAVELDVPIIWIIAPLTAFGIDALTGNPNNPSYIPDVTSGVPTQMTFLQRLWNVHEYILNYLYHTVIFEKRSLSIFLNIFPVRNVAMNDLYKKVTLVFRHGHHALVPRPNLPNVIEIGGIHIKEQKPLAKDLEHFVQEAKHGVIFFSFGTSIAASSIPESKLDIFREVFAQIPQRVLWRCDKLNATGFSSNVKFGTWFPQRDILAHRNVRAFISHGGLLGTYEAIYTSVPIIGIPLFYDQETVLRILEEKEVAVLLDFDSLTAKKLLDVINDVMNGTKYRRNMQHLSEIFRDVPMSPLDTVIYWTEYIIRHNGAQHLRSAAADMPFYQYLLLDVIVFFSVSISLSVYLIYALVTNVISCVKKVRVTQ